MHPHRGRRLRAAASGADAHHVKILTMAAVRRILPSAMSSPVAKKLARQRAAKRRSTEVRKTTARRYGNAADYLPLPTPEETAAAKEAFLDAYRRVGTIAGAVHEVGHWPHHGVPLAEGRSRVR